MTSTPHTLYIHDDLTGLAALRPETADLARQLLDLVRRDARVRILTLDAQVEAVAAQGPHEPFAIAVGIAAAGEAVARALHARTGWFPAIQRVEVAREENASGGYDLATGAAGSLAAQLASVGRAPSIAVVDDTVFSGLTLDAVLRALPPGALARTRAFCLRGVEASIRALRALCPITVGVAAAGRLLDDVSFINASGLVRRGAIRRVGQAPLAFYERPEWIEAWFPGDAAEVIVRCAELARRLGDGSPTAARV
jgi:hypothetical protein